MKQPTPKSMNILLIKQFEEESKKEDNIVYAFVMRQNREVVQSQQIDADLQQILS